MELYKMRKRLQDDWRARVRGLERVASALRTSSALIAIEPRLGSLLHAVLGCERSCRVAAAGLAVAKVTRKFAPLNQSNCFTHSYVLLSNLTVAHQYILVLLPVHSCETSD